MNLITTIQGMNTKVTESEDSGLKGNKLSSLKELISLTESGPVIISGLSASGKTFVAESFPDRKPFALDSIGFKADGKWMTDVSKIVNDPLAHTVVVGTSDNLSEVADEIRSHYAEHKVKLSLVFIVPSYALFVKSNALKAAEKRAENDLTFVPGWERKAKATQSEFKRELKRKFDALVNNIRPEEVYIYENYPKSPEEIKDGWHRT